MNAVAWEWILLVGRIVVAIAIACLTFFIYKLIRIRLLFYRLRRAGLPTPPWNPILGNLPAMAELKRKGPGDTRQAELFALLSTETPGLEAGFYVDVWPFNAPMLVVTSPKLAIEACQSNNLPKPDALHPFINPMAGGSDNLFVSNGPSWKRARELFNNSFSMTASMGHLSCILEEAEIFVEMLKVHAREGKTFSLDQLTCRYAMDIIGNVAMNTRFKYQRQHHPIAAAMRNIIEMECGHETNSVFGRLNPVKAYVQWQNGRTLNRLIAVELEKCYRDWKQSITNPPSKSRSNSIMDLVIAEYMKSRPRVEQNLDPDFKTWATIQIRLFLFVGHDSEATTIIYSLYLLSKHPEILSQIRQEHDNVFGPGVSSAVEKLGKHPETINQLPYTLAVIKETLRLFPPANGLRSGLPGVSLCGEDGKLYPTGGFAIWTVHSAIHRNPLSWPQPHSFIPDRWLVEPGHSLYPPTGGWRPFEFGTRSCIGQNISLLGVKVTLALIVRQFNFENRYNEYDRLNPSNDLKTMFGERAYMIQKGAGHPAQGFPCRVTLTDSYMP